MADTNTDTPPPAIPLEQITPRAAAAGGTAAAGSDEYDKARAAADAKRAAAVSKSKQIAAKFEMLLQMKLRAFFRVELTSVALAVFSLIISAVCTSFSPALTFNAFPLVANCAIIIIGSFGASLLYIKNSLDKTQYIITGWFALYLIVFLFGIVAEAFIIFATVVASITCSPQALAANGPPLCLRSSLLGLLGFNCFLFFALLSLRGVTMWMGFQLFMLLTKTKNAVVRATAKVDMRRSMSTRRKASFHSVDGSERITEPAPRKPIPQFKPDTDSKTDLVAPDPALAVTAEP